MNQTTYENQHTAYHHVAPAAKEDNSNVFVLVLVTVLMIVIIGLSGGMYYMYTQYSSLQKKLENPTVLADEELNMTIDKVAKLIELPEGEKPILATVSDREKLEGQPFFENAIMGDKVLIYAQAKKAVLYRPSTNKVINVAPVAVNTSPTPGNQTDTNEDPATTETGENIQNNPDVSKSVE